MIAGAALFLFGSLAAGVLAPRIQAPASSIRSKALLLAACLAWCGLMATLAAVVSPMRRIRERLRPGKRRAEPPHRSARVVPGAGVLRAHGHAHRPGRVRPRPACSVWPPRSPLPRSSASRPARSGCRGRARRPAPIGIGMIPRGEVGLIFASIGLTLDDRRRAGRSTRRVFSAVVVMVIVTTLVTPPALKWSFAAGRSGSLRKKNIPVDNLKNAADVVTTFVFLLRKNVARGGRACWRSNCYAGCVISRLIARVLVVLVLSPVTAPFSTCELGSVVGGAQTGRPIRPCRSGCRRATTGRRPRPPAPFSPPSASRGRIRLLTPTSRRASSVSRRGAVTLADNSSSRRIISAHATPVTNLRV